MGDYLVIGGILLLVFHITMLIFCVIRSKKLLWITHFILELLSFASVFILLSFSEHFISEAGEAIGLVFISALAIYAFAIMFGISLVAGIITWIVRKCCKERQEP